MPRIWKFEDNINTDVITPGRFNLTTDPEKLAECCFCEVRPAFPKEVRAGDIVLAGRNFGCGSSRETAPLAIKSAGVQAVVATTFARIFYRNAINLGLPAITAPEAVKMFSDGDAVELDLENHVLKSADGKKTCHFEEFPDFIREIFDAGGLIEYIDRGK